MPPSSPTLFLSSDGLPDSLRPHLLKLLPPQSRLGVIAHALDLRPAIKKYKIAEFIEQLSSLIRIEQIDVQELKETDSADILTSLDALWVMGGDLFYLRYILHQNNFDSLLVKAVQQGLIYAGSSAGAIIAGPTLEYFDLDGSSHQEPETILEGLNLTGTIIIPHWQYSETHQFFKNIAKLHHQAGRNVKTLTDGQAVIVQDGLETIVE